jgi:predicted nucleic acid-binding protein
MISTNGSRGRQFVDTNVLVYAHDKTAGDKQLRARELIEHLWDTGQGYLSLQVLQEFYVTVTRKWVYQLPTTAAIQLLKDFSRWNVHRPTSRDLVAAAMLQQQYQISFWDALILTSAQRCKCTIVWSEDLNTGQSYQNVTVRSPFR